jgi:quercetin dioxygenase-like cupin family protein
MSASNPTIAPAEAFVLRSLITPTEQGIASRVLTRNAGGNITLFAFDAGQGLSEHTSPFEALVLTLEGRLILTIGGTPVTANPGTIVRMPANVPHGVDAPEPARMLLIMLRDTPAAAGR